MRYWKYAEPNNPEKDDFSSVITTLSDEDILKEYWDYWYGRMCDKFGKDHVDANYSPQDCIDDWVIVHWAIESKE